MIGSPYYWGFVAAVTVAFAAVDLVALSRRDLGRPQGVAIVVYVTTWVIVLGLAFPVAPLGALWWVFPAAVRIAAIAMFVGGQTLAGAVRVEQSVVHHDGEHRAPPPTHELTQAELHEAEEYDARWQREERERIRRARRPEPLPDVLRARFESADGSADEDVGRTVR